MVSSQGQLSYFLQLMVYYLLNVSYGTNTRCSADKRTLLLEIALTVAGLRSLEDRPDFT